MFEVFGKMESAEIINQTADGLLNEGDHKNILLLAQENGIDQEITEMFCNGEIPYLCDTMSAAVGRIDVEARELNVKEIMKDWIEYIKARCQENEKVAAVIMQKDKSLTGCLGIILKWSSEARYELPESIVKASGINVGPSGKITVGMPGSGTVKKLINEYYKGER